jgi:basic membrane protein A
VTDLGTIDDGSFNQGSWEGLKQYAEEKKISHKYYQPAEQSDDAYLATIDLAVKGGAKLIVTPGFLFEVPVYKAQDIYPDVKFILIDGYPNDGDWSLPNGPTEKTGPNAVGVKYAEEQSGFLAGYAAVKDGYTKLGFMGGMAVPAVISFGYGYVQGAILAAEEMGLGAGAVSINYHYTGNFNQTPEAQTMAASWYSSGIEVIFACGGQVFFSVNAAAEAAGKYVIGVDVDQSEVNGQKNPQVITSATKGLKASVYACVADNYANKFPGGQNLVFNAANDGVSLPMATSKFKTFKQADYDNIYAKLVNGSVRINNFLGHESASEIANSVVSVTEW